MLFITLDVSGGKQQTVAAKANVYASLDDAAENGIHMPRLHAILNRLSTKVCNKDELDLLLKNIVTSQAGTSQSAKVDLAFDMLLPKTSLLSNERGFQTYRIEINGQWLSDIYDYGLKITVPYSSTGPCSAALSRQLFENAIDD